MAARAAGSRSPFSVPPPFMETVTDDRYSDPLSPLDQWRQRLGGRRRRVQPRPLAAMGYLADGPVTDGLIEVENLTIVLLYDEPIRMGIVPFGWPDIPAAAYRGASASAATISASF